MNPILRRLNPDLLGKVRSLFIVLSDDLFAQILSKFDKKAKPGPSSSGPPAEVLVTPPGTAPPKNRNRTAKRGASSDLGSTAKK